MTLLDRDQTGQWDDEDGATSDEHGIAHEVPEYAEVMEFMSAVEGYDHEPFRRVAPLRRRRRS